MLTKGERNSFVNSVCLSAILIMTELVEAKAFEGLLNRYFGK